MKFKNIDELLHARESEDHVEFKAARREMKYAPNENSNDFRCVLGYVVAFANAGGGSLVLGVSDEHPHRVVGTTAFQNRLGELEAKIYRDIKIRTKVEEVFCENERIVIIEIPSRPVGKVYLLNGIPLTRIGEQLLTMDEAEKKRIEREIEDDFSSYICEGASLDDIDPNALDILKAKYRRANPGSYLPENEDEQLLSDLKLISSGKVTYAALILLGKEQSIERFLPQAIIRVEYRQHETDIRFNKRVDYRKGFYLTIEELWDAINSVNKRNFILEGPYSFPVDFFNEGVIREAICNAVAHRDYRKNSETIIKICDDSFTVQNAGGFPPGVTLGNLISVPSTPRNKLLAEVLNHTGLVERSGQGVDRIFRDTLSEGKGMPDYSNSTDWLVELRIPAAVEDAAFVRFVNYENSILEKKLSVTDIINLYRILHGEEVPYDKIRGLLSRNLIASVGKTRAVHYELAKSYYEFAGRAAASSREFLADNPQLLYDFISAFLRRRGKVKMRDFIEILGNLMSVKQIRAHIRLFCDAGKLSSSGHGPATVYFLPHKETHSSSHHRNGDAG